MNKRILGVSLLLAGAAFGVGAAPTERGSDLVVHEWGTFLAMQGSDGVTLDGMYHEEHALPAFVHSRSRDGPRNAGSGQGAQRRRQTGELAG